MAVDVCLELIAVTFSRWRAWTLLVSAFDSRRPLAAACVTAALALSLAAFRTFPLSGEVLYNESKIKPVLAVALASRATLIAGDDYWVVWPVVYGEIAARQRGGEARPKVFGIVFRGEVVADLVEAAFTEQPQRTMLCVGITAQECATRLGEYVRPFSWTECANPVETGSIDGLRYAVLALAPVANGLSCPGTVVKSSWDDLTPLAQLTSLATRHNGAIVVSKDGPPGLAIFGPYQAIDAGHYRVSWRLIPSDLQATSEDTPLLRLDVVDDYGASVLATGVLTRGDLIRVDPDHLTATIDFASGRELKHCELRLWRLAPVQIVIDNIRLVVVR
jgi:hypothetical protein